MTAIYPGQSAEKVSVEVASPIEEQVNGVENMLYMESQCTNDGSMRLTVTFKVGTNPDTAQVLVQNRWPSPPPDSRRSSGPSASSPRSLDCHPPRRLAVLRREGRPGPRDPGRTRKGPVDDQLTVSNYARLNVTDELARLDGVGDVVVPGRAGVLGPGLARPEQDGRRQPVRRRRGGRHPGRT